MTRPNSRGFTVGPFGTIFGALVPWLIGVTMLVKWVIEGLF